MALMACLAKVDKRCSLAALQLVLAHEKVDGNTQFFMLNDFLAALALWRGGVLTLPMKVTLIHPMVQVTVVLCLALLIECDQQDMDFFVIQRHMAAVPIAGIELLIK